MLFTCQYAPYFGRVGRGVVPCCTPVNMLPTLGEWEGEQGHAVHLSICSLLWEREGK